ncbi:unnamed protein product [Nippostrongylus brasiliensis]|uniref:Uncharacterized protein n=1 Tax=Nippostrongylus brasiliensis TaxID=27835 RepID=A0A0N4Y6C1_NIPBR|nr:unnamed protein product [Nippostrongylus brasiliensis]
MGIADDQNDPKEDQCLQEFSTITYNKEEQRYYVKLPFKTYPVNIPTNRELAFLRLVSNVKMLRSNPTYMEKYHAIFQDQLQRKIIEEIDENPNRNAIQYLAHHGVVTESRKHTKIRCVFDGCEKRKEHRSLNEDLFKRPNLLPDILGILLRIRAMPIFITSDIERAFLMVGLHEDSRDYTRFFWLRDPNKGTTKSNVTAYRFRRVPFGRHHSYSLTPFITIL